MVEKKLNLSDPAIQIRILKALEDVKPFGIFKHFYMIRIIRNLKQPNIIEAKHIWQYLDLEYGTKKYDEKANLILKNDSITFDMIFED